MIPIQARDLDHLKQLVADNIREHGNKCDLNHIDVSQVTDMMALFQDSLFDGDISKWNVSNVQNMSMMFWGSSFKGDVSQWNVGQVTNMVGVFAYSQFNGDISGWNTSSVSQMDSLFQESAFNGDISEWNTSGVSRMAVMFQNSAFNGDISKWDVSQVTRMERMFSDSKFNGNISQWNVARVTNMDYMFSHSMFNGDIGSWQVHSVRSMNSMFEGSKFNGALDKWNVENVRHMERMFKNSIFDGALSSWNPLSLGSAHLDSLDSWRQLEAGRQRSVEQAQLGKRSCYADHLGENGGIEAAALKERLYLNRLYSNFGNGLDTSAVSMFEGARFSGDISMWPIPLQCATEDMFKDNAAGLAAQGTSLWTAMLHAKQGSVPSDGNTAAWMSELHAQALPEHALVRAVQDRFRLALPEPAVPIKATDPWHLHGLVRQEILLRGADCDLNHIDVSAITSLASMFKGTPFVGDISQWDVSNVSSFEATFENCPFNGDISQWDTARVNCMERMFKDSLFNGDISQWNTSRVLNMSEMFMNSAFNQPIDGWNVKKVATTRAMFEGSSFVQDISSWELSKLGHKHYLFLGLLDEIDEVDSVSPDPAKETQEETDKRMANWNLFANHTMFGRATMGKIQRTTESEPEWASCSNMFAGNLDGLRAQTQPKPWVIKECVAQRCIPQEETWKHVFTTCLGMVESLHDSVDERVAALIELHKNQHRVEEAYDVGAAFD